MSIPRREWSAFLIRTIERLSPDNTEASKNYWTNVHYAYSLLGHMTELVGSAYWSWKTLAFPTSPSFALVESLDTVLDAGVEYTLHLLSNSAGATSGVCFWQPQTYPANPLPTWDPNLVTGKYRNGVDDWDHYPPYGGTSGGDSKIFDPSTLPENFESWIPAYDGNPRGYEGSANLFKNGMVFYWTNYGGVATPFIHNGDACTGFVVFSRLKVNFFNAIVNSLSRYTVPPSGGVSLVLSGLGFDPSDAEYNSTSRSKQNLNHIWHSEVDKIEFIGQQGQGTTTLTFAGGDFTRDSDTQITIPSMPALAYGTYRIKITKEHVDQAALDLEVISYAGRYRCHLSDDPAVDGFIYDGDEIFLFVSDQEDRNQREGSPVILTDWQLKDKLDLSFVDRSYAPKDVCCTAKFYDGRLREVSGLKRAINDETGVFISSDMSAKLVNVDKEFSKLLAQYYFKNEPVEMFVAFKDYPESLRTQFFRGFVEDHKLKGGEFDVDIRDLTTVFFQRKVPCYRVTKEEYPNAHDSAVGRPMQELIGEISYVATEASGAIEALLVDVTAHRYLAARGSLKAIPQVYVDGALQGAGYSIVYADGGRTYIDFTADQGEKKVTFNCQGYMYVAWNSVNGFIQHPVYVFLFYLTILLGVPLEYVDLESFEKVKTILDDLDSGIPTSGYLGLIEETDSMEITRELCQTIGGSFFPDRYGRLKLDMKNISNITTSKFIFTGIDTMEPPDQDAGLKEAINRVKASWNYIPAASRYLGSKEEERAEAVDALSGNYQEQTQPLEMKWTTNEVLVDKQIFNILYKRGKGYKRIKIKLPLTFVDYLDIYNSFRLQDPYGISLDGSGDYGRYLYVESIDYGWIESTMEVTALDLSYIMRRYLVLGDEDSLPSNWSLTTEESKAFAYLCDEVTGLFADGEEGKILVDENKIAM